MFLDAEVTEVHTELQVLGWSRVIHHIDDLMEPCIADNVVVALEHKLEVPARFLFESENATFVGELESPCMSLSDSEPYPEIIPGKRRRRVI